MPSKRTAYDRLPSCSTQGIEDIEEFKDKPIFRRSRFSFQSRKFRRYFLRFCRPIYLLLLLFGLLGLQLAFNKSYVESHATNFKIDKQERVYIAANIVDGELITSSWGPNLLSLIKLIGPERVFVSIYGRPTDVLKKLSTMLECDHRIVSEQDQPYNLETLPRVLLPDGTQRIKRIAFLAAIRNKVLEPLKELEKEGKEFGKVLFLNDVYFNPTEVLRLIWGTNVNENGESEYKAACAADFDTSWKYYDTFATRDAEGYSLGIPIYPWFASKGEAVSRKDVLAGRDAVRVSSCWGGMVSFDARYFTSKNLSTNNTAAEVVDHSTALNEDLMEKLPLQFRSEPEPFWDSSECCLIHADIIALPPFRSSLSDTKKFDTGIYMNPYVRTAYSARAFAWIPVTKYFERLFAPIQLLVNPLVKLPRLNSRRTEKPGQKVDDLAWVNFNVNNQSLDTFKLDIHKAENSWSQTGYYDHVQRIAGRGGYCGVRQLLVLKEDRFPAQKNGKGGGNWENLLGSIPPPNI
ncbi:hypothetical protein K3495_g5127 [Podosphaera aphanis]|nr:hypothetical protein K3495_g5127 [Podosphaera aphanis]